MKQLWNDELFWGALLIVIGGAALIVTNYFDKRSIGALIAACGIIGLATLWGVADLNSPVWCVLGLMGLSCLHVFWTGNAEI